MLTTPFSAKLNTFDHINNAPMLLNVSYDWKKTFVRITFFLQFSTFCVQRFSKIPFCLASIVLAESELKSAFAFRACQFVRQMDFLCVSSFLIFLFFASVSR